MDPINQNMGSTGLRTIFPWDAAAQQDPQNRDLWSSLNPQQGESMDAYSARLLKAASDNPQIKAQITAQISKLAQAKADPNGAWAKQVAGLFGMSTNTDPNITGAGGGTPGGPGALDRNQATDDFYRMMMNPNDPSLLAAQDRAGNLAQRSAAGRGLVGGLSEAGIAKAGMDSRNSLLLQRQGMGMAAIQQGIGYDIARNGQSFDQNQSNAINAANQQRGLMQAGVSAGGQIVSGLADLAKDNGSKPPSGIGGSYGSSYYPAADMPQANYPGAGGQYPTSNPSDWSNPY